MILLVCTLLTIISACANNNPGLAPSVPQYDYEYTTLEQLSDKADIIAIGTVESVEQADDSNYFYHIDGLSVIRGAKHGFHYRLRKLGFDKRMRQILPVPLSERLRILAHAPHPVR